MIWNEQRECEDLETRRKRQLADLKELCFRLYDRVPFYRARFDAAGLTPADIRQLSDLSRIPFTTKDELRETYPYGLLAVDESELREIHTSSGTTGTPVVGAYTDADISLWGEVAARCLCMAGGRRGDVVQNAYGYGMFTGGLGLHYGARALGANIIPAASGNTKRQLMLMRDFKSTILTCTPSYALHMAEVAKELSIDPDRLHLNIGVFGAEPWSNAMRAEIENKLHLKAFDIYGLTEIIGPGVSCECAAQNGLHVNEDHFYPEIIDARTGEVLPDGETGELVLTTLTGRARRSCDIARGISPGSILLPAPAAAPCGGCTGCWAATTTCSSCGASTCFPPRSKMCSCASRKPSPTTRSSSSGAPPTWTRWSCRWKWRKISFRMKPRNWNASGARFTAS